jgi:hypothetical protein
MARARVPAFSANPIHAPPLDHCRAGVLGSEKKAGVASRQAVAHRLSLPAHATTMLSYCSFDDPDGGFQDSERVA